jgi:hypothetical protein
MTRRLARSAAALAVAASLGGCTAATVKGDDTAYISNPQEEVFVRIPTGWAQLSINPYRANTTDRIDGIPRSPNGWARMADAAPKPSERHADATSPEHPVAILTVLDLPTDWRSQNTTGRDGISLSLLRGLASGEAGAGVDPLPAFNDGDPNVELISYRDAFMDGRTWGTHVRANFRLQTDPADPGRDRWTTVDQWALVDYRQSKLYRLTVKCEASCFRKNKAEIDRIVSSFRIKGINVPPFADGGEGDGIVVDSRIEAAENHQKVTPA